MFFGFEKLCSSILIVESRRVCLGLFFSFDYFLYLFLVGCLVVVDVEVIDRVFVLVVD